MLIDTALYFSSLPSKISSHSDAFSRVTLVASDGQWGRKETCHLVHKFEVVNLNSIKALSVATCSTTLTSEG